MDNIFHDIHVIQNIFAKSKNQKSFQDYQQISSKSTNIQNENDILQERIINSPYAHNIQPQQREKIKRDDIV